MSPTYDEEVCACSVKYTEVPLMFPYLTFLCACTSEIGVGSSRTIDLPQIQAT